MKPRKFFRPISSGWQALIWLGLAALTGCVPFSPDGGFGLAQEAAQSRLGKDARWIRSEAEREQTQHRVQTLLAEPLSMEDAVQIALLNNPGLQARYAELGIAEADLVQAGRLPNPSLSFSRLHAAGELNIDRTFSLNVLQLLAAPFATRIEQKRFTQARFAAANETLKMAAEARRAYTDALAAQQWAAYAEHVSDTAQAGAELARRMTRTGNFSKLDYLREQAFYADAVANQARARNSARIAREKLTRALGLWGRDVTYTLPERLPDLPAARWDSNALEHAAMENRFDVRAARWRVQGIASNLGLTRATRMVNVLDAGFSHNSETNVGRENGWEVRLEIPLFDWSGARIARARTLYLQSAEHLREIAIGARSEIRQAYGNYQTHYELARHYQDEIVPLRKRISEETLLRYNGMLASVFDLLAATREQIDAQRDAMSALHDYWLADADLRSALGGQLPASLSGTQPVLTQPSTH